MKGFEHISLSRLPTNRLQVTLISLSSERQSYRDPLAGNTTHNAQTSLAQWAGSKVSIHKQILYDFAAAFLVLLAAMVPG